MKRLSFLSSFFFGASVLLMPSIVFGADDTYGLKATAGAAGLTKYGPDLPALIGNVIGTMLSLVSVIFFALMIYGGIKWMISRGNEDQSKKALDTIIAAIIGIIIVLASYAITTFVFSSVGSAAGGGGITTQAQDTKKADGSACTLATQCTSGVCTSGVCVVAVDVNSCTNGGTVCPTGQTCNTVSQECLLDSQVDCTQPGLSCPSGKTCDLATKTCVAAVDVSSCINGGAVCPTGQTCNTVSQECLLDSQVDCTQPGLSCPSGKTCDLATKTCV